MKLFLIFLVMLNTSLINAQIKTPNGLFKFSVKDSKNELIYDYRITVVNESTKAEINYDSKNLPVPMPLDSGSYIIYCSSGNLYCTVVGLIIYPNKITFYDFILVTKEEENKVSKSGKYRKKNKIN